MELRPMVDSDVESISRIVMDTWDMEMYGKEIAYPSSECYVRSCWAGSSFSFSAVEDGNVVGCIVCNIGWNIRGRMENSKVTRQCNKAISNLPGYDVFRKDIEVMEKANQKMKDRSRVLYDSQIVLFIVSEECRGKGYGRALYEKALEEISANNCRRVLILTDNDCGYSFYDKDGCKKLYETDVELAYEKLHMMLYVKDIVAKEQ